MFFHLLSKPHSDVCRETVLNILLYPVIWVNGTVLTCFWKFKKSCECVLSVDLMFYDVSEER